MEFTPASQNGIVPPTELLSLPSRFGVLVSNTSTYYGKPLLVKAVSDAAMYKTEAVSFYSVKNGTTSLLGTSTFINTTTAILVLNNISTGTHDIYASWPGEGLYAPVSTILDKISVAVAAGADLPGTFTITAGPASGTIIAGSGVNATFTATFSTQDVITGNVIFYNGVSQLASVPIENNRAVLSVGNLPAGDNIIKVVWPGGTLKGVNYQGRSAELTYNILRGLTINSPMTIRVTPGYGVYNEGNIKISATIANPTELPGKVYFSIDNEPLYYAAFSGNTATIEFGNNAYNIGARTIEALWDGNQTAYPRYVEKSTSTTWTIYERDFINITNFTVTPRTAYGYDTVFKAVLDKNNAVGNIGFYNGNTLFGNAAIVGNSATFITRSLAVGTYTVYAYYDGNSVAPKYFSTTSNTATMVVTEGVEITQAMNLAVTNDSYFGTTDPYVVGENQTIKATLSTSTVLTGPVRFYVDDILQGTANWNGYNTATFTTTFTTTGSHAVQAVWPGQSIGNVFYATKVSTVSTLTLVSGYTMGRNITLSTVTPVIVNQPSTFIASINTSSTMTGLVSFTVNGTTVGTSTWINNISTLETTISNTGTYTIQALWQGGVIDGTRVYNAKLSTTATHVVVPTVTPTVTANIASILVQEDIPFNLTSTILGTAAFPINNSLDILQEVLNIDYDISHNIQTSSTSLVKTVNLTSTSTQTSVLLASITQLYEDPAYPYISPTNINFSFNEKLYPGGSYRRYFYTRFNSGTGFNSTSSSRLTMDVVPRVSTSTIGLYCLGYATSGEKLVANKILLVGLDRKTHRLYFSSPNTSTSGVVTFNYTGYNNQTLSSTATMIKGVAYTDVFMTDFAWGDNPVSAQFNGQTYSQKLNIIGRVPSNWTQYYNGKTFLPTTVVPIADSIVALEGFTMRINLNRYCYSTLGSPSLDQTTGKYYYQLTSPVTSFTNTRDATNKYYFDDNLVDSVVITNGYISVPYAASENNGTGSPNNRTNLASWYSKYASDGLYISGSTSVYYVGDYVYDQVIGVEGVAHIYRCRVQHNTEYYGQNSNNKGTRPYYRSDLWQLIL